MLFHEVNANNKVASQTQEVMDTGTVEYYQPPVHTAAMTQGDPQETGTSLPRDPLALAWRRYSGLLLYETTISCAQIHDYTPVIESQQPFIFLNSYCLEWTKMFDVISLAAPQKANLSSKAR